jgi:hypothetical protein
MQEGDLSPAMAATRLVDRRAKAMLQSHSLTSSNGTPPTNHASDFSSTTRSTTMACKLLLPSSTYVFLSNGRQTHCTAPQDRFHIARVLPHITSHGRAKDLS